LFVNDDLVNIVDNHIDLVFVRNALKLAFHFDDEAHIFTLISQTQAIRLSEGGSIKEYLKALKLQN